MLRSILSHAGKNPLPRNGATSQSYWEGTEAVVTSGMEAALSQCEQPWLASLSLLTPHKPLRLKTPFFSLHPLHMPRKHLPSSPAPLNRHHYCDYYCLSGWWIHNKALACFVRRFVLVFVFVGSWLCQGGISRTVCFNRPSGWNASIGHRAWSGIIYNTLDLVQLTDLPLSPLCESLLSWSFLLCGLSCTALWIVPALHASKYSLFFVGLLYIHMVCKEFNNDPVC